MISDKFYTELIQLTRKHNLTTNDIQQVSSFLLRRHIDLKVKDAILENIDNGPRMYGPSRPIPIGPQPTKLAHIKEIF